VKTLKTLILVAVLALGVTPWARADLYEITFTDAGANNVGSGQIDVVGGAAVSGYFDVTAGAAAGLDWILYAAGGSTTYPNYFTSPAGGFWYNNAVYLTANPQYPAANPFLDNYGLLFTDGSGDELNLWGNSDGSYTLYGDINHDEYNPQTTSFDVTLMPIPEPSTITITGALLLVPICASTLRFTRKKLIAATI